MFYIVDLHTHTAQADVAQAADDAKANSKEVTHVDLRGLRLVDYVAWAMNHRPSIEAAHLAVTNAALELSRVTSDRELQLNLSSGFSQSTANRSPHFSWHQDRGKFTSDVSLDLLIYDFGRIDARERQARENLVAAQRNLADAEFAVFNDVAKSYFTPSRSSRTTRCWRSPARTSSSTRSTSGRRSRCSRKGR